MARYLEERKWMRNLYEIDETYMYVAQFIFVAADLKRNKNSYIFNQ